MGVQGLLRQTQDDPLPGPLQGQTRLVLTGADADPVATGGRTGRTLPQLLDNVLQQQRRDGHLGVARQGVAPVVGGLRGQAHHLHHLGDQSGGQRRHRRTQRPGL